MNWLWIHETFMNSMVMVMADHEPCSFIHELDKVHELIHEFIIHELKFHELFMNHIMPFMNHIMLFMNCHLSFMDYS